MLLRQYAYLRVAEFLKVTNRNSLNVLVCSVVDPVVRNIAEVRSKIADAHHRKKLSNWVGYILNLLIHGS